MRRHGLSLLAITFPLAVASALFAVANREPVPVRIPLLPGHHELPLYAVVFLSLGLGFLMGLAQALAGRAGRRRRERMKKRES